MRRSNLVALLAALCVAPAARIARAQLSPTESDRMVITELTPAPTVLFDNSIPEIPTAGEPPLVFAGGPAPVAPFIPSGVIGTLPGNFVVFLTELAPDPGEPPIIISTPTGPQFISDAVISAFQNPTGAPPHVEFISDGGPDLQELVNSYPNFSAPAAFIPETGFLQDVTPYLVTSGGGATPFGVITIQVASDVPEPASLALVGVSAAGLLVRRRRA
jgi:hypothetical protein